MDNLLNIFLILVSIIGIASASYVVAQTNVFRAALALDLSDAGLLDPRCAAFQRRQPSSPPW